MVVADGGGSNVMGCVMAWDSEPVPNLSGCDGGGVVSWLGGMFSGGYSADCALPADNGVVCYGGGSLASGIPVMSYNSLIPLNDVSLGGGTETVGMTCSEYVSSSVDSGGVPCTVVGMTPSCNMAASGGRATVSGGVSLSSGGNV